MRNSKQDELFSALFSATISAHCTYQKFVRVVQRTHLSTVVNFSSANMTNEFVIGSVRRTQPGSIIFCCETQIQEFDGVKFLTRSTQPILDTVGQSAIIVSYAMDCDSA